jgi:hypothetical protein
MSCQVVRVRSCGPAISVSTDSGQMVATDSAVSGATRVGEREQRARNLGAEDL